MIEYIEKEKIRQAICDYGKGCINDNIKSLDPVDDVINISRLVDYIRPADVVPVTHAKWIRREKEGAIFADYECSICSSYPTGSIRSHYCPNCGAKMDGKEIKGV